MSSDISANIYGDPYIKVNAEGEILEALGDFMGIIVQNMYTYEVTSPAISKEIKAICQNHKIYTGDIHRITHDDDVTPIQLHATMLTQDEIMIIFKSISEDLTSPLPIQKPLELTLDSEGKIIDFNKAFQEQFFHTQEVLPQTQLSQYLYYKDRLLFAQTIKEITAQPKEDNIFLRMQIVLDNFLLRVLWSFKLEEGKIKAKGIPQSIHIKSPQISTKYKLHNTCGVGVWQWNFHDKSAMIVNQAVNEIIGFDGDQIDYQQWLSAIHPEDRLIMHDALLKHQNKEKDTYTCSYRIQNGKEWKWVSAAGVLLRNEEGTVHRMQGILFDIDQNNIQNDRIKHFDYLEYVRDAVITTDLAGTILFANQAAGELLGYTNDALQNCNIAEIYHGELPKQLFSQLKKRGRDSKLIKEWQVNHQHAGKLPIEACISMVKDYQGRASGLIYVIRDLTEVKFYQNTIKQSVDQLREITDKVDIALWEYDIERHVYSFFTPHIKTLTGYSVGHWLSTPDFLYQNLHPDHQNIVKEKYKYYLQNPGNHSINYQLRRADGAFIWINEHITVIKDNEGKLSVRGFMVDISKDVSLEESLQESQNRYKLLAENQTDLFLILNRDLSISYVGKNVEDLYGYTVEEIKKLTLSDIVHPDSMDLIQNVILDIPKHTFDKVAPRTFSAEVNFIRKDGGTFWGEVNANRLFDDGIFIGYSTSVRDVTERVFHRKEIEKLATLIDLTSNGIVIADSEGHAKYLNHGFVELVGFSKFDLLGQNLKDILHGPQTSEETALQIKAALQNLQAFSKDILYYHKDGHEVWVNINAKPVDLGEDEILFVGVYTDITERVKQNKEINKLATLVNLASFGILILGDHGAMEYVNAGFEKLTGYTKDELLGKYPREILHGPETDLEVNKTILNAYEHQDSFDVEILNYSKTHKPFWVKIDARPIEVDGVTKYIAIVSDITERVEQRREIEKLATVIDFSDNGIVITDMNGIVEYVNQGYTKITGYSKEELIGANPQKLLQGKSTSVVTKNKINKAMYDIKPINENILNYRKDGTEFWVSINAKPIEVRGEIKFVFIQNDITEIVEKNKEIEQLATMIDLTNNGIVITDRNGIIEYINQEYQNYTGYSRIELLGMKAGLLQGEKTSEETKQYIRNAIKTTKPFKAELLNYRKDGTEFWVSINAKPIEVQGEIKYLAVVMDITERIQQTKEIQELATLINLSNNGIIVMDKHGVIEYANTGLVNLLGHSKQELVGNVPTTILQNIHSSDQAKESIQKALEIGKAFNVDVPNYRPNGQTIWINVDAKPIQLGEEVKFVGIISDITERIHQSREIEKLAKMIELSGNGILITDRNGITEYVNQGVVDLTGYPKEELIGQIIGGKVQGANTSLNEVQTMSQAIKDLKPFNVDIINYHKDGTEYWVNINSKPVQFRDEVKYVGVQTDITDRVLQSKEIQKLATLIDLTTNGILITDQFGYIEYTNQGIEKLTGYSKEEMLSNTPGSLLRGTNTSKKTSKKIDKAISQLKPFNVNILHYNKQGDEYWVNINAKPTKIGNQTLYLRVHTDITQSKINQERIKEISDRLKLATQAADLAVWQWDLINDQILWYKLSMAEEEIIYQGPIDGFAKMLSKASKVILSSILADAKKGIVHDEFVFSMTKDNTNSTIKGNFLLSYDHLGRPEMLYGMTSDITQQKEKEKENVQLIKDLKQRNKANEDFAQVISHNLRAPLANIIGLTQMMQDGHEIDQTILTQGLSQSAHQIDLVVKDLNDILSLGNQELEISTFNLTDIIDDIIQKYQSQIDQQNIHIKYNILVDSLTTSRHHIYSIFYNLISNAVKYNNPNQDEPTIWISTLNKGNKLILSVRDNGIGIDLQRHKNRLFKMYQRLNSKKEGRGLGLYLIKKQAEELGGWVNVESESYKGSTFTINFPKSIITNLKEF